MLPNGKSVKYRSDIFFTPKSTDLVLMDEGDTVIFGRPEKFKAFSS